MMQSEFFGRLPDGREAHLYTLQNRAGMTATVTDIGASIVSMVVPDRNGVVSDVTFGYDSAEGYFNGTQFIGGTIGRYANRIAGGEFVLDGKVYHLAQNNGRNSLHGGPAGFYRQLWRVEPKESKVAPSLRCIYVSRDGEEGYPGELIATVTFMLHDDNSLEIRYEAESDKPTIVNLTNHSYFNLSGDAGKTILDNELMINADSYTPVSSVQIPTGEIAPVGGTPMDFRRPTTIGERLNADNEQLKIGRGYDLNWVLAQRDGKVSPAAELYDPASGRVLEVLTDQPGLQFYSGNFLDGSQVGKKGAAYQFRTALCLETQHYPDSPNRPHFPSTVLRPGEKYLSTTVFKFSVKK